MRKIITKSAPETKRLASQLAKKFIKSKPIKQARVLGLVGELGSGKTTFIQGFIKMLGVRHRVMSPTFLIFRPYPIRSNKYKTAYHVDLYRIHSRKELTRLGFKGILANRRNVILIEWADKLRHYLPRETIWIHFSHGESQNERIIVIESEAALKI